MTKITLNEIQSHSPCKDSWKILLKSYNKTKADNTVVTINHLLKTLDVPDTLWVIDRCVNDKRRIQLMSTQFAKRVLHIWENWARNNAKEHLEAPRKLIELIEKGASKKEIASAAAYASAAAAAAVAAVASAVAAVASAVAAAAVAVANAVAVAAVASAAAVAVASAAAVAERKAQEKIILKYFGEKDD